jgi:hypothetical protein
MDAAGLLPIERRLEGRFWTPSAFGVDSDAVTIWQLISPSESTLLRHKSFLTSTSHSRCSGRCYHGLHEEDIRSSSKNRPSRENRSVVVVASPPFLSGMPAPRPKLARASPSIFSPIDFSPSDSGMK